MSSNIITPEDLPIDQLSLEDKPQHKFRHGPKKDRSNKKKDINLNEPSEKPQRERKPRK